MKDIISQIEDIRDIKRQHKLVIFVGVEVSKNSGICSWWELVKAFADLIVYRLMSCHFFFILLYDK